jgi:hypothetical protein
MTKEKDRTVRRIRPQHLETRRRIGPAALLG